VDETDGVGAGCWGAGVTMTGGTGGARVEDEVVVATLGALAVAVLAPTSACTLTAPRLLAKLGKVALRQRAGSELPAALVPGGAPTRA
jgi:hypothetical protein